MPEVTPNLIERVYEFNKLAMATPPGHFNADRVGFYTGMQLEEMAETIKCIAMGHVVNSEREQMLQFSVLMDIWGKEFKAGKHYGAVLRADREELLDGAIDGLVVAAGSLVYQTPQYKGAVEHVLGCNDAKIVDGVVIRDANGKLVKPAGWVKPDLSPYVDMPDTSSDNLR